MIKHWNRNYFFIKIAGIHVFFMVSFFCHYFFFGGGSFGRRKWLHKLALKQWKLLKVIHLLETMKMLLKVVVPKDHLVQKCILNVISNYHTKIPRGPREPRLPHAQKVWKIIKCLPTAFLPVRTPLSKFLDALTEDQTELIPWTISSCISCSWTSTLILHCHGKTIRKTTQHYCEKKQSGDIVFRLFLYQCHDWCSFSFITSEQLKWNQTRQCDTFYTN